jgi:hypothetical protein
MSYVVRASGGLLRDRPAWLSIGWPDGRRDFVSRELAATFDTTVSAQAAIDDVYEVFREPAAGIQFTIERDE